MALLLTLGCGLFFLVGIIAYKFIKNKKVFTNFSIGCATVVLLGLIGFDLMPELIEINEPIMILFVILGLGLLLIVDKLVPHHEHDHVDNDEDKLEHIEHLSHISTITIIALLLHNMIEGMALYGVASSSISSGLLMMLGIGLHNLPFGFQIASSIDKKNIILLVALVLSGFIGGLVFSIFGGVTEFVEGIIIALTLGMLLHILVFELFREVYQNIAKKESIYGIIVGIVLVIIINII